MSGFVANCKISGPAEVGARADVDFNGLQWNYTIGLMFPKDSSSQTFQMQLPTVFGPGSHGKYGGR
jgi:hypothetical protein